MASIEAVRVVGESIVQSLESRYPAVLRNRFGATFALLSTGELAQEQGLDPAVTLVLYRVAVSSHLRNSRTLAHPDRPVPLALDLHYLLTVWATSSEAEQVLMAWAMHELHRRPVLDAGALLPAGGFAPGEAIQIIPEELSSDAMARIWESFQPSYRLSAPYVARVVLVQGDEVETENRRVVVKDLKYGAPEERP